MVEDPFLRREWFAVANLADVPEDKPHAVELLGRKVVLWKAGSQVLAWEDLCIHRGARLSLGRVEGGCLRCPYHGWTYDATGACVRIPAHPRQVPPPRAKAKGYACREAYGWIWVALEEPASGVPHFPEWGSKDYRNFVRGPYRIRAQGPRVIENFLDLAHFAFVHPGILGDEMRPEVAKYNVTTTATGVEATDIEVWQPDGAGTGQGSMVQYTYKVTHPLVAYLAKQAGQVRITLMLSTTPVDEQNTLAWLNMAVQNADFIPDPALIEYVDRIFLQDVPIVESQRPEFLPLDLQAELHLNSDRTSIAYRLWLRELGMVYGTA
jgi:phenylpropionate dioxygenase-like ring-hydroxylating dioxygenase large terminal subunit